MTTVHEKGPIASELAVVTGAWLDAQTFPPLRWVVYGILAEGLTILAGAPKLGKSWLVLALALAAASGSKALGAIETGDPRPVLLCALEDGYRRLQQRSRQLHDGPLPEKLEIVTKGSALQLKTFIIDWLLGHANESPLVIIDTLGKIMPDERQGESAYARDYRVIGDLKNIIDTVTGASMVLVHHTRKMQGSDFLESVSGTQGIAGAADSTLVLARPRHEKGAILAVTGRDVMENEYSITSEGGRWTLDGRSLTEAAQAAKDARATANLGDRSTTVLSFVNARTETRAADLAAHLDIDQKLAGTLLSQAFEAGRISKPTRGVYVPLESLESLESASAVIPLFKDSNGFKTSFNNEGDE